MQRTLIVGGARSGKSRRALGLAEAHQGALVFVATAEAWDEEMAARISAHQRERDQRWRTVEAPLELAGALTSEPSPGTIIVVDCLTLWLSNIMHAECDIADESARLVDAIARARGPLVLVSNEVGFGLVPETPLGRAFRDHQGRLNQAVAAVCDRVELVVAGLPLILKG